MNRQFGVLKIPQWEWEWRAKPIWRLSQSLCLLANDPWSVLYNFRFEFAFIICLIRQPPKPQLGPPNCGQRAIINIDCSIGFYLLSAQHTRLCETSFWWTMVSTIQNNTEDRKCPNIYCSSGSSLCGLSLSLSLILSNLEAEARPIYPLASLLMCI